MNGRTTRSGGGAGRSTRGQRGGVGRARRNAGTPRPRPLVLNNATLAALDVELQEQEDSTQDQEEMLLACPYYKNDPLRHRECIKYNLTSVNYVKQHLHRCHGRPPYCPTCYAKFDDDASCNAHIVARVCEGPPPGAERPVGVDAAQRSELNRRVRRTLSIEDQWLEVYRILFGQDAQRPASVFKGDPVVEVTAAIDVIWKANARAMVNEALATGLSGPDAPMLLANVIVEGLLERALSLVSQPSSQGTTLTAPATLSRATTALNSQVGGGAPAIKSEPSQTDRLQPVPLDPDLFRPAHSNTLAHDNNPHVDNTYLGLAAVAAATYTPGPGPAPTYPLNPAAAPTFTADPMTIDSPKVGFTYSYMTDLGISPSPEPEQQAGPSRPPRRKRKTPTSLSASSRSGSLDSAMTLDSPTYGWRVGF
ncbi:hypothetical protein B0T18DRAFT_417357 [Schizothecium vesticola]|uniref:C2H2-type domain-containing protein n=1 Tax=Schizothecium vesticola TaxID=314040 RepID=A0AA40EIY6_9PEZI|nr:hypothetical protein B0T18DRAFT_417357 [Schizothecium vesticola]